MYIVRSYGKYIELQPLNLVAELYIASAKCDNVVLIPKAGKAHTASFIYEYLHFQTLLGENQPHQSL